MAKFFFSALVTLIVIALGSASVVLGQANEVNSDTGKPVVLTTQDDHRNMLKQLGITKPRLGRSGNADVPHGANYDQAKANRSRQLAEILQTSAGTEVTTAEQWTKIPRPELVRPVTVDMLDGALAWRQHDGGDTDGPNVKHFIGWSMKQRGKDDEESGADTHHEQDGKSATNTTGPDSRSLKEAIGDRFQIGVGVAHDALGDPANAALIKKHFRILTPENCMKPQGIHPQEDRWNFGPTDAFADFARKNQLDIVGHCLVWAKDDRTDAWMMKDGEKDVSREKLLGRIEEHINTVVGRYADVTTMWDVVNEAIGDGEEGLLRDSVYSRTAGIDFIVTAFQAARAADPQALLIYNDYHGHKPEKRKRLIELLTKLKEAGAPIDAYGMQGHFELGGNSIPQLRETFDELRKLGVKIVISELDIDVVKRGRWWAEGGKYREELATYDPYKEGLPEEIRNQQIAQYVALFELFDDYSDIIERVSFWNLHDGQSWLNDFPWRRVNYPLLFDRQGRPKAVFDAVYQALTAEPATTVRHGNPHPKP